MGTTCAEPRILAAPGCPDAAHASHVVGEADPAATIGACNDDNVPDDQRAGWQFAGWCWSHDHFTEGKGTPVGWLPMHPDLRADLRADIIEGTVEVTSPAQPD